MLFSAFLSPFYHRPRANIFEAVVKSRSTLRPFLPPIFGCVCPATLSFLTL